MMADYDNKSAEWHNIKRRHELMGKEMQKLDGEIKLNKENLSIAELNKRILQLDEEMKKMISGFLTKVSDFTKKMAILLMSHHLTQHYQLCMVIKNLSLLLQNGLLIIMNQTQMLPPKVIN